MTIKLKFTVEEYFAAHRTLFNLISSSDINNAIDAIALKFNEGKKILVCGNGGSAMNASHYITDWNKMISIATGRKFHGISLTDNIGLITAFANDYDFDDIFVGQLKSILNPGDLVIGLSGSGNSKNVINAINYANANDASTLCIVGYDGGILKKISNIYVHIPSFDMQLCEDFHLMFGHMVMKSLCGYSISM